MAKSGASSRLRQPGDGGSTDTRRVLVDAAIETLKSEGFAGASARAIAGRAGCNQGLVFYHFGSVVNLLLAALDAVSADRLKHYRAAVERVTSPSELIDVASAVFREDLDAGHVTVLVEMIAGASSTPGLGPEVAARIAPWTQFVQAATQAAFGGSALDSVIPPDAVARGIVALYLGLEMLTHLDGDRSPALELFDRAKQLATLFHGLGGLPSEATPQEA
ncbi:MAG TPA: TetR/AcrR family transcriptional regulator [Acidimicrobiales bacterium]